MSSGKTKPGKCDWSLDRAEVTGRTAEQLRSAEVTEPDGPSDAEVIRMAQVTHHSAEPALSVSIVASNGEYVGYPFDRFGHPTESEVVFGPIAGRSDDLDALRRFVAYVFDVEVAEVSLPKPSDLCETWRVHVTAGHACTMVPGFTDNDVRQARRLGTPLANLAGLVERTAEPD